MSTFVQRAFRHWADHSTGTGMLARSVRRVALRLAHGGYRVGNIAMLHAGRCGSSVLADLLNQHPDVRWANEPFEGMKPAYYRMNSEHRAYHVIANRMYAQKAKYFGFDSKYLPEQHLRPELANKTPEEYIRLLKRLGFGHFVLLDRRNHLRRAVSVAIGTRDGQWNSFKAVGATSPVRLDPERFISYGASMPLLDYFRSLETTYEGLKACLAGSRVLELTYEDDIQGGPHLGYWKCCDFVGMPRAPVDVRLKKLNERPVSGLIENFSDVVATLYGTPYEWMLRE